MQATPGIMQDVICAGQDYVEPVPFSVSVIGSYVFAYIVCVSVAAAANIVSFTKIETGAHAPASLFALLLFAFLLTCLTLTGLARLSGLRSLVGPKTRLATSTA